MGGLPDLALKLSIPDLVEALQLEEAIESEVDLLLRGRLLDGTRFEARDSLVVTR